MGWSSLRAVAKDEVFRLEGLLGQNTKQRDFSNSLLLSAPYPVFQNIEQKRPQKSCKIYHCCRHSGFQKENKQALNLAQRTFFHNGNQTAFWPLATQITENVASNFRLDSREAQQPGLTGTNSLTPSLTNWSKSSRRRPEGLRVDTQFTLAYTQDLPAVLGA